MSHLLTEEGKAGLWRWFCAACGQRSRRWWNHPNAARYAARAHSLALHPEYHDQAV